jgi:hypothetical protein
MKNTKSQQNKKIKVLLDSLDNNVQYLEYKNRLNNLPITILWHLSTFLLGIDALSFGECVSNNIMASNRHFWIRIGP